MQTCKPASIKDKLPKIERAPFLPRTVYFAGLILQSQRVARLHGRLGGVGEGETERAARQRHAHLLQAQAAGAQSSRRRSG